MSNTLDELRVLQRSGKGYHTRRIAGQGADEIERLNNQTFALVSEISGLRRELAAAKEDAEVWVANSKQWSLQYERQAAELAEARGLLGRLAKRHEWTPYGGPCICEEHVAARAALINVDQPKHVNPQESMRGASGFAASGQQTAWDGGNNGD